MTRPKLLDLIIRSGPAQFLKEHRFRKKGRVFYRNVGSVFQYVHFFTSKYTSAQVANFTLEIGATFRFRHPNPPEKMLTSLIPIVGRRFGPVLDHPIGQFWITDSVEPTATEIIGCMKDHVFPYLEEYSSEEAVYGMWTASGCMIQEPTVSIPD